jgi:hypothetical protein
LNIIDYSTLLLLAVTKTRFSILIFKLGYVILNERKLQVVKDGQKCKEEEEASWRLE